MALYTLYMARYGPVHPVYGPIWLYITRIWPDMALYYPDMAGYGRIWPWVRPDGPARYPGYGQMALPGTLYTGRYPVYRSILTLYLGTPSHSDIGTGTMMTDGRVRERREGCTQGGTHLPGTYRWSIYRAIWAILDPIRPY